MQTVEELQVPPEFEKEQAPPSPKPVTKVVKITLPQTHSGDDQGNVGEAKNDSEASKNGMKFPFQHPYRPSR